MAKIPVGATIAGAYRFAFRDFLKILGVMWLPMAILWIPSLFFRARMMAVSTGDPTMLRQMLPFLIPFYVVAFILMVMQVIGIARLALGTHTGSHWVYFSLGRPVWRLVGSLLLLAIAAIIGWFIALLGGLAAGFLLDLLAKAVNFQPFSATLVVAVALILIAIWCGYFYCLIRLSFLLLPVIAIEEQGFALGRAWELGKGNFWRMFVVLVGVLLPFLILEGILVFTVFQGVPFPPTPATPQQMAAFQVAVNMHTIAMINDSYRHWYLVFPPAIALMVLFYGIVTGAQCLAYRSLSAPVAGDALPD